MKSYTEFLNETATKAMHIEQLAAICQKIVKEISEKVGLPLGLVQQGITLMDKPFPHLHCKREIISNGLEEDDKFLTDEACQTFEKLSEIDGLTVHTVKEDEDHGNPGDLIAKTQIIKN
jgi:hypothetical protein